MTTLRPHYYDLFKCIADRCAHSCCKGWEIDIDEDSMGRYEQYPDIRCHIKDSGFVLQGEDERCPFLNKTGLCDLILKYGEDILCDICTDHPRFRNYIGDTEYLGIGMCCEAACDLILNDTAPFALLPSGEVLFGIDKVDAYKGNISEYIKQLYPEDCGCKDRTAFYLTLECLNPKWDELLNSLSDDPVTQDTRNAYIDSNSRAFRNLLKYFLYRHMGHRGFAAESVRLIAESAVRSGHDLSDICRMYSAEIEYSDENAILIKQRVST